MMPFVTAGFFVNCAQISAPIPLCLSSYAFYCLCAFLCLHGVFVPLYAHCNCVCVFHSLCVSMLCSLSFSLNLPDKLPEWHGVSSSRFCTMFPQFLGLMLVYTLELIDYPVFLLYYYAFTSYGYQGVFVVNVLCVAFVPIVCAAAALLCKALVLRRLEPGNYPVYGSYYVRWWIVRNITQFAQKVCAAWDRVLYFDVNHILSLMNLLLTMCLQLHACITAT